MKSYPLYLELDYHKCKTLYNQLSKRKALSTLEEIKTEEHAQIDDLVFDYLDLDHQKRKEVAKNLELLITARTNKSTKK